MNGPQQSAEPMSCTLCEICVTNKATKTGCEHCAYRMCRSCAQRWVMDDDATASPRCPACMTTWCKATCRGLLSATFMATKYRERERKRLLALELSRLPDTAHAAKKAALTREYQRLSMEMQRVVRQLEVQQPMEEALLEECIALRARLARVHRSLGELAASGTQPSEVLRCSHRDCVGVVDGVTGQCTRCEGKTCPVCHEPHGESHVCDPAVVESLQLIKEQCRPCGACGAMSVRTEGCPVMWCAHCHAFWNWDTGIVVSSRGGLANAPHNPDHRVWLASDRQSMPSPREQGDVPCGGLPNGDFVRHVTVQTLGAQFHVVDNYMAAVVLVCAHGAINEADRRLRRSYPVAHDDRMLCHDLRVALLLGDMDEETFSRRVEQRQRKKQMQMAVGLVAEGFTFAGIDVMLRFVAQPDLSALMSCAADMIALRDIANDAMAQIGVEFHRRVPHLSESWQWKLPYARAQR